MGRIGLADRARRPGHASTPSSRRPTRPAASSARPTRGVTWEKRSDYVSGSPQYYQELFVDPEDADRVYSMDVFAAGLRRRRQDLAQPRRALQARRQPRALDRPRRHRPLPGRLRRRPLRELRPRRDLALHRQPADHPVLPRRRATTRRPFYHVYGGTQDNFTLGGPSRTRQRARHHEHRLVRHPGRRRLPRAVDPDDPNIVYAESQYGVLVALRPQDRRAASTSSRSRAPGEPPLRWNWDSPLIICPHTPHAALLRRATASSAATTAATPGQPVSGDLTRQLDRNKLPVMGKVWGAGRGRQERVDLVLRQHRRARRVAARRRACSTSAPTTAWSR